MKTRILTTLMVLLCNFALFGQAPGLVAGNLNITNFPAALGGGKFQVSGTFSDPTGRWFAADVDTGMIMWKGNDLFKIDSILVRSGSSLTFRVQDTYSVGFIATGNAQVLELSPNLRIPGVAPSGDSNSALTPAPDHASLMNYILKQIDANVILSEAKKLEYDSKNSGVQFKDEGSNLGIVGTVTAVNVTGSGATASRSGNTVTIDVPAGGVSSSSNEKTFLIEDMGFLVDSVRDGSSLVRVGNYLYLLGGWSAGLIGGRIVTNSVWRAHIDSITLWRKMPNASWSPRHTFASGVKGDTIFVWGGDYYTYFKSGETFSNIASAHDVWRGVGGASGAITWTKIGDLPYVERWVYGFAIHNGKLVTIGGQRSEGNSPDAGMTDVWVSANGTTWVRKNNTATWASKNLAGSVISFNSALYVISGGVYPSQTTRTIYKSVDDGESWTQIADFPGFGSQYASTWSDGIYLYYAFGGITPSETLPPTKTSWGSMQVWRMSKAEVWEEIKNNTIPPVHAASSLYTSEVGTIIACGTGGFTYATSANFYRIVGVDTTRFIAEGLNGAIVTRKRTTSLLDTLYNTAAIPALAGSSNGKFPLSSIPIVGENGLLIGNADKIGYDSKQGLFGVNIRPSYPLHVNTLKYRSNAKQVYITNRNMDELFSLSNDGTANFRLGFNLAGAPAFTYTAGTMNISEGFLSVMFKPSNVNTLSISSTLISALKTASFNNLTDAVQLGGVTVLSENTSRVLSFGSTLSVNKYFDRIDFFVRNASTTGVVSRMRLVDGVNGNLTIGSNIDPQATLHVNGDCIITSTIWLSSSKTIGIFTGTGNPDGVVIASPGSTFHSQSGAFYVKQTGVGNTGWVAK
jgi:hypothetical protein